MITAAITGIRPAAADGTGSGTEAEPWLVSTWSGLYEKLREGGRIRLTADVTYGQGGGDHAGSPLAVNAEVTLDLNGHTIDRGLKDAQADFYGWVIKVESSGNLTLKDTAGDGLITGGKSSYYGGGVYVAKGCSFTMEGGTISGNSAAISGGGAYDLGTFTMEGGTISGNSATYGGGVYAYVGEGDSFNLSGSPVITGNTTEGTAAGNVYLWSGVFITVTGPLTGADASVGVTMDYASAPFTNTGTDRLSFNDPLKFFSDNSAAAVGKDPGTKQLYLGTRVYISGISAADKIYDGTTDASITGTAVLNYVSDDTQVPGLTVSGITAAFADKNVGNGKNVVITGALLSDAASFRLDLNKTNEQLGLTAAVSPKQVKVNVTAKDRPYESGNTEVEITGASIADGEIISGETLTLDNITNAKGTMADDNPGIDKTETVSGFALGGSDNGNYALPDPVTTTVTIRDYWPAEKRSASGSAKYGKSGEIDISALIAPDVSVSAIDFTYVQAGGAETTDMPDELAEEPQITSEDKIFKFSFREIRSYIGHTIKVILKVPESTNY